MLNKNRKKIPTNVLFILALFFLQASLIAKVPAYRHDHINIFPEKSISKSSSKIKLDGDLSDWDSDAFISMATGKETKKKFSIRIAFAYGKRGLLYAVEIIDSSPMANSIDPVAHPNKGWAGDCLQMRFIADPKVKLGISHDELEKMPKAHERLSTFLTWYYAPKNLSAVYISGWWRCKFPNKWENINRILVGKKSLSYFKKGSGKYFLEGLLTWSSLRVNKPALGGASWIMNIQALWGGFGVNALGHNFYDCVINSGLAYQTSKAWGRGYFVKASEVDSKLKEQKEYDSKLWEEGESNDKEKYFIRLKYKNPMKGYVSLAICNKKGQIVRTLLTKQMRNAGEITEKWDGLDDDGKGVAVGEYSLKALSHPGLKTKFICSVMNSGNPPWVSDDGNGSWAGDHGFPIDVDSSENGISYLLWNHNELGVGAIAVNNLGKKIWGYYLDRGAFDGLFQAIVYDKYTNKVYLAQDGQYHWVKEKEYKDNIKGGIYAIDAKTGRRTLLPWGKSKKQLSYTSKKLYIDRKNKLETLSNIVGLAVSKDFIFCSLNLEDKILSINKKTGKIIKSYKVKSPAGIAYSEKTNKIYAVSENSIVSIELENGKIATIVNSKLDKPRGITLDKRGNILVSVQGKQMQVRIYSPKGRFIHAIGIDRGRPAIGKFNKNGMFKPFGISVDNLNRLWVMEFDESPKRQSVWDVGTGKFIKDFYGNCEYSTSVAVDPDIPKHLYAHGCRFIIDYEKGTWKVDSTLTRLNFPYMGFSFYSFKVAEIFGKKFAFLGATTHGASEIFSLKNNRANLVSLLSSKINLNSQFGIEYSTMAGGDKKKYSTLKWNDKNKNGIPENGEFEEYWNGFLYGQRRYGGGDFYRGGVYIAANRIFRPKRLDSKGVPVYPYPDKAEQIKCKKLKSYNKIDTVPVLNSDYKEFYAIASEKYDPKTRNGLGKQGVYRYKNNGEVLWRYARVAIDFATKSQNSKTGDIFGAMRVLGQVKVPKINGGSIFTIVSYYGYYVLLTEDGLYIDSIGEDMRTAPSPGKNQIFTEAWSGYFFKHKKTGKIYLIGGDTDIRILEIQGWDKIKRFNAGKVNVSLKETINIAKYNLKKKKERNHLVEVNIKQKSIKFTKSLKDWEDAQFNTIKIKGKASAKFALAYDKTYLYAIFKVDDKSPWINSASDWRYLFKGGDAIDIQLGEGKLKEKIKPGNIRIIIASAENKNGFDAVGIWPLVNKRIKKQPQAYTSPVWTKKYERVAKINNVKCIVNKTPKGYIAQIAIPWNEIGFTYSKKLRGDIGVLISDSSGRRTVLRSYLFNHSHTSKITMDAPTESILEPEYWGKLNINSNNK